MNIVDELDNILEESLISYSDNIYWINFKDHETHPGIVYIEKQKDYPPRIGTIQYSLTTDSFIKLASNLKRKYYIFYRVKNIYKDRTKYSVEGENLWIMLYLN